MNQHSLQHVGVLGMKWGVHRRNPSQDSTQATTLKKKHVSEMSNEELKTLTTRLQLEKQYKDLTKTEMSPGRKFANEMLSKIGKQLLSSYIDKNLGKNFESVMNHAQEAANRHRPASNQTINSTFVD
jgi:hypothetical protein